MMELCVSKFKESEGLYVGPKEAGYCLLRSQLLMAFHDSPTFRHLANQVPPPLPLQYVINILTFETLIYIKFKKLTALASGTWPTRVPLLLCNMSPTY